MCNSHVLSVEQASYYGLPSGKHVTIILDQHVVTGFSRKFRVEGDIIKVGGKNLNLKAHR